MAARIRPTFVVLVAILVVAAGLRLWALDFGFPGAFARPDENTTVRRAVAMGSGDLNPHHFQYPSLYIYLTAMAIGVQVAVGLATGRYDDLTAAGIAFIDDPGAAYLTARLLTAAIGILTVALTFAVGRRLAGERSGLVAAALVAVNYLHVRNSHFATNDVPLAAACLAVLGLSLAIVAGGSVRAYLLAGAAVGVAGSIKYPGAFAGVVVVAAHLLAPHPRRHRWLVAAGALAIAVFAVTSPYFFLDFEQARGELLYQYWHSRIGHLEMLRPGALGKTRLDGLVYHLTTTLPVGLGGPGLALAATGLVAVAARRRRPEILVAIASLALFLTLGSWSTHFTRYMVPLVAPLALLAAIAVDWLAQRVRRPGLAVVALVVVAGVVPAARSIAFDRLLATEDSRAAAARSLCDGFAGEPVQVLYLTRTGDRYDMRYPRLPETLATRREKIRSYLGADALSEFDRRDPRPGCAFDVVTLGRDDRAWTAPLAVFADPVSHPGYRENLTEADAARLATDYEELRTFGAAPPASARFELDDMFFVPYSGLRDVVEPGPVVTIYRRRTAAAPGG